MKIFRYNKENEFGWSSDKLYYHIKGQDQGIASTESPAYVWDVFDLYDMPFKVTILDHCNPKCMYPLDAPLVTWTTTIIYTNNINIQWSLTYPGTSVSRLSVWITEFPDKWVISVGMGFGSQTCVWISE